MRVLSYERKRRPRLPDQNSNGGGKKTPLVLGRKRIFGREAKGYSWHQGAALLTEEGGGGVRWLDRGGGKNDSDTWKRGESGQRRKNSKK